MITITGKCTKAKIMTDMVEPDVIKQVTFLCNHPLFENKKIALMPDCHPGSGTCIGLVAEIDRNHIIPWLIGSDIGCSVSATKIKSKNIKDFAKLDKIIKSYKPNKNSSEYKSLVFEIEQICSRHKWNPNTYINSLGIGGGNHFLSIEQGKDTYLIIHTGSRVLGKDIYLHYCKLALEQNLYADCGELKQLSYLNEKSSQDYILDMLSAQIYASLNHYLLINYILENMNWKKEDTIFCPHNYIDLDNNIIHKGSISLINNIGIIPINMADGTLLVSSKYNQDWLCSAPHGAGRIMKRCDAKERLNMKEYKEKMKNVYSTCVNTSTIDESPMVYKPIEQIKECIEPTCTILDHLKPLYNYKVS